MTPQEIRALAHKWGFRGDDEITATAIALAESKGDPNAVSPPNKDGTKDYGLWQINSSHFGKLSLGTFGLGEIFVTQDNVLDPDTNAKAAYKLYSNRHGFGDWTTYNDGSYKNFLPQAKGTQAASGIGSAVSDYFNTGDPNGVANEAAKATGIPQLLTWLGDTLPIVGFSLLAAILFILGVGILLSRSKAAKTVGKAAVKFVP